eukprot:12679696-Alexandrium_andersonii.AAC.1
MYHSPWQVVVWACRQSPPRQQANHVCPKTATQREGPVSPRPARKQAGQNERQGIVTAYRPVVTPPRQTAC